MMGIFSKIGDYFNNRYDIKLERGLRRLEQKMKFDPQFQKVALEYMTSSRRTQKLTEWHTWYMGDEYILRHYFTQLKVGSVLGALGSANLNLFWEKAPDNYIMVHTGWPGIISRKMAEIIFEDGYSINVKVFKKSKTDDGTEFVSDKVDDKESARIHDLLRDVLLAKTKFNDLLPTMAEDESWSGHTALKFSFDKEISPFPIIESADARNFSIKKERGHTTEIIFHEWKTIDVGSKKTFRRDEIYTTVRNEAELSYYKQWVFRKDPRPLSIGDAVIRIELYQIKESEEKAIPFAQWQKVCPELMKGNDQESYSFPEIQGMIAFEKPNRMPNNDFPGSGYGASDYSRCVVSFDKLDELYSDNAREVRDNKAYTKIPKSMLPKDKEGKVLSRNPFQTNILIDDTDIDQSQGRTSDIQATQIEDRTESILGKWKIEVSQICANAGISPTSFGIFGFEAINADDKSQQEREKATIGTLKKKRAGWAPYLNGVLLKLLEFNSWLRECYGQELIQPGVDEMNIDFTNCNVKVSFQDYVKASTKEKINTWGEAVEKGVCDTETAVKKIFDKSSADEQKDIVTRIYFEQGVSSDNPSALSMKKLLEEAEE